MPTTALDAPPRAVLCCGRCRQPFTVVVIHHTAHTEDAAGVHSVFALCESCWSALTPEQRWPHYEHAVCGRPVKPPRKKLVLVKRLVEEEVQQPAPVASMGPDGQEVAETVTVKRTRMVEEPNLVDDPADQARYAREVQAREDHLATLKAAVLEGK